jgi:3-oxoacyl-[acyl-carrier protein] reductase
VSARELEGRVALVTGGSRGIGQAISVELARAGAFVGFTYRASGEGARETSKRIEEAGGRGQPIECDVADLAAVDNVITTLVHDLRGTWNVCKAALRPLLRARGGRIINLSSVVAEMGNPGQSNYAASKGGVEALTRSLAREVGSRGITVNAVAPGFIETDMTRGLAADVQKALLERIPLGRFGAVEDVAAAVRFLASDAAAYITGQVIHVNGGLD